MLKKKGVSPLVATILLIGFVIALLLVVFLWGKKYIEESAAKRGALAEKQYECELIKYEVVSAARQGDFVRTVIKNLKDIKIHKFSFVIGDDRTESVDVIETLKGLEVKEYSARFTEQIIGTFSKVSIVPWLKVAPGYYVPCSNKKIVANV